MKKKHVEYEAEIKKEIAGVLKKHETVLASKEKAKYEELQKLRAKQADEVTEIQNENEVQLQQLRNEIDELRKRLKFNEFQGKQTVHFDDTAKKGSRHH